MYTFFQQFYAICITNLIQSYKMHRLFFLFSCECFLLVCFFYIIEFLKVFSQRYLIFYQIVYVTWNISGYRNNNFDGLALDLIAYHNWFSTLFASHLLKSFYSCPVLKNLNYSFYGNRCLADERMYRVILKYLFCLKNVAKLYDMLVVDYIKEEQVGQKHVFRIAIYIVQNLRRLIFCFL